VLLGNSFISPKLSLTCTKDLTKGSQCWFASLTAFHLIISFIHFYIVI
jgi:hypothetical protein